MDVPEHGMDGIQPTGVVAAGMMHPGALPSLAPSGQTPVPANDGNEAWETPSVTPTITQGIPAAGAPYVPTPPPPPTPPSPPMPPAPPATPVNQPIPFTSTGTAKPELISVATPKSGGSLIKMLLGIFVALVIVSGVIIGLMFADDSGYLPTGLSATFRFIPVSGLWGGLSANPTAAALQIATAISKQSSFSFQGTTTPSGQAPLGLIQTDSTTSAASTSRLDVFSVASSFSVVTSKRNYQVTYTVTDNGIPVQNQYRVVDGDLYISGTFGSAADASNTTTPTWLKSGTAPGLDIDKIRSSFNTTLATARLVGREKLSGEDTYHFLVSITGADTGFFSAFDTNPTARLWIKSNGPLDVWVSRKTHLPMQFKTVLTLSDKSSLTVDVLAAKNQQSQTITAPDNVIDASALLTPDQHKKADLTTIAKALAKYYAAKGTYPVAATMEKLSKTGSVLDTSLIPDYLDQIPADSDGTHYYGYVSDGATYQLSAVLENASDPDATKSGTLNLYIVSSPVAVDSGTVTQ